MDGAETVKAVRERDKDVNITLVTGYADDVVAQQAMENGANNLLLKPLRLKRLIEVLDKPNVSLHTNANDR